VPYLSFIRARENQGPPPRALMDAMGPFVQKSLADGSVIQTGGLAQGSSGFRIRMTGGKLKTIDGPYAEAKEVIGGWALLGAKTREEAVKTAQRFMDLHITHWPEFECECEVREITFLAP